MFFVYILQSEKTNQFYIGHSDDPERRLIEHNESPHNTFTSKHRPWKLMAQIPIGEIRGEAMRIEKYIKGRKSRSFNETLILKQNDTNFVENLKRLALSE